MTKRTVTLSTPALMDVTSIVEYVAEQHGIDHAINVDSLIEGAVRSLEQMPDSGRVVESLARRGISTFREIVAAPYRIVHRVTGRDVRVLAIVDGRRQLDDLLFERARR